MQRIETFLRLANRAVAIRDSDASWEAKYDLVFSSEISEAISEIGAKISYADPDMTYEKDVRAFVDALEEKATNLKKTLASIS